MMSAREASAAAAGRAYLQARVAQLAADDFVAAPGDWSCHPDVHGHRWHQSPSGKLRIREDTCQVFTEPGTGRLWWLVGEKDWHYGPDRENTEGRIPRMRLPPTQCKVQLEEQFVEGESTNWTRQFVEGYWWHLAPSGQQLVREDMCQEFTDPDTGRSWWLVGDSLWHYAPELV